MVERFSGRESYTQPTIIFFIFISKFARSYSQFKIDTELYEALCAVLKGRQSSSVHENENDDAIDARWRTKIIFITRANSVRLTKVRSILTQDIISWSEFLNFL